MGVDPILAAQALVCAFFAILFLQSGIDKVVDRRGNLEWLVPHFEKSPLRGAVPVLLTLLTVAELGSGLSSGAAVFSLVFGWTPGLEVWALSACGATLALLFFGQRVAKDYAGAASLAAYFAVAVIGLSLAAV